MRGEVYAYDVTVPATEVPADEPVRRDDDPERRGIAPERALQHFATS